MADPPDLLFFDTFSHESSEELNLDLVQFPKPVYVSEVRIIPLGARVQGDFPGGVRLGATNPTQFKIDFFVNDLSKPGASTFETLGSLEYCQNGRIHMDCEGSPDNPRQIPTDGLVLRGWYTTITLAVYGTITKNITEQVSTSSGSVAEVAPPTVAISTPPPTVNNAQPWSELPPDVYPTSSYSQDSYDQANYQSDYYGGDGPKDPRSYHGGNGMWDDKERSREREINHSREKDRTRHNSIVRDGVRLRSRSTERGRSRDRNSPLSRYSRSHSRERDYSLIRTSIRDDGFRRDESRSPGYRERSLSREKDWDRNYKRDDYRRHRQPSYDRSRGGSYEKKRNSPYDKRAPSYERRPSYENRTSPYDKRGSSYEKLIRLSPYETRASSYEKRVYDKRAPSYDRMRDSNFDSRSRSPTREDPRKRPRTPPLEHSRRPHTPMEILAQNRDNISPVESVVSEEGVLDYDHGSKCAQHKSYKNRSNSLKNELEKIHPPKDINNYDSGVLTSVGDGESSPNHKVVTPLDSPCQTQEDNVSMDTEQYEPILSDEDICDDMDGSFVEMDYDLNEYCRVDDILKYFNPFRAEWQPYVPGNKSLLYLSNADCAKHVMNASIAELCLLSANFQKLADIIFIFERREENFSPENFSSLTADAKEVWVDACEQLSLLISNIANESDIMYRVFKNSGNDDIRTFILNFCHIGLDYELALSQNEATCKIKHIKCGIRLLDSLSSQKYNEIIIMSLLNNGIDVYAKLLELYSKDYMGLSMKLMILNSLNSCLGSEATIEHFLDIRNESGLNGYQKLIMMLRRNPPSRIKFPINALISKLNLYELLKRLHENVLHLNAKSNNDQVISETEIELIINSLEEILFLCRNGTFELSQPQRFLPVSTQFDINKNCVNDVLITFFQIHKFIETCLCLLTCPLTYNFPVITNPIYEIMSHLVNMHEGLIYLSENMKTCDLLFKTLLQPYMHHSEEEQLMALQDFNGCTSFQQLGFEMAYKLQVLYYVNALNDIQSASDSSESEIFDKLHGLYCLGFEKVGKLALINVLSMGDNMQALLDVIEKDIKSAEKGDSQRKKSPAKNYAVDIIVQTIQFCTDVNFLKKFGKKILNVATKFEVFEQSIASNLQDVLPYLKPLEKLNIFSDDNVLDLVDVLKSSIEHVTSAPGDLITSLRILKHLCIPECENKKLPLHEPTKVQFTELKFKYVVIKLYSLDGVSIMTSILEKLCNYFEQPSLHTATFVSIHGFHIVNIVLPTLELLNKMLTYVIRCRNTQFKDLTSIPVILQTYNLMYSYPVTAVGYKMAQRACRECIEILLAYTQPITDDRSENESIDKSLWTKTLNEVIKYVLTGPYTFMPGLLILSELIPLPLPIQTKYPLTGVELSTTVRNRKLWSAHLHTLSIELAEMIQTICPSVCQPVVQLLRRVCIQLTDLASNMSLCVTKAVLDLLASNLHSENNTPIQPVNYNVARILQFLAILALHPSVKCTILHLVRQSSSVPKSEEKYGSFIPMLSGILTTVSNLQSHVQAQEWVVSIISSLYDSENTLFTQLDSVPQVNTEIKTEVQVKSEFQEDETSTKPVLTSEIYLANAIPSKDILITLISSSLEYLSNENSVPSVILAILRTFFLLTEHDYGFYYFKFCIEKNKQVFSQLLGRLVDGITKISAECITMLFELLKTLQSTTEDLETTEGLQFVPRTSFLSVQELAEFIGWHKNKEQHPLLTLEKFLKKINAEDEITNHVRQLLLQLSQCSSAPVESQIIPVPPVLGNPEHIVTQFNGRCLWTQGDAQDERLGLGYWLGISSQTEEDGVDNEMIPCDLVELARSCLPAETDLVAEVERLLHLPPAAPRPPTEIAMFRTKRLHVPRDKRPYISPARGRGVPQLGVGLNISGTRVQVDAFRSRPPNTSRPPSLHVDDFLALEGCGAQPTGPTGYNKVPIMSSRGGRGMRARGISITDRGRFASTTPTTSIYRRGRGNWTTVSSAGNTTSDGSPPLSSHFSRVSTSQHYQSPLMQHSTSSAGWGGGGTSRGSRRGRGLRHGRSSFLR